MSDDVSAPVEPVERFRGPEVPARGRESQEGPLSSEPEAFGYELADAPDLVLVLGLDEAGLVEWAAAFLRKRGWRVSEPIPVRRELPGQTTVEQQIAELS